jgi:hypothetical protein
MMIYSTYSKNRKKKKTEIVILDNSKVKVKVKYWHLWGNKLVRFIKILGGDISV